MVYSALAFLVLSLISTGVYYFTGYLNDPLRGFFDSVSAFSATGLSLFPKPLELPVWLRIFRAGCQWIGGGMSLAILALLMSSPDGDSMAGETSETFYRFGKSFNTAFKRLILVYLSLTVVLLALLAVTGCGFSDSVCVAFATISTGGMSPGPVLPNGFSETVVMAFMLLTSISYPIYYYAVRKRTRKLEKNTEVTVFLGIVVVLCVLVSASLAISGTYGVRESVELGCFHTVSNISTTGLALDDISKSILIRKAALDTASELKVYRRKLDAPGFIDQVRKMITEFYQYNVTPAQLEAAEKELALEDWQYLYRYAHGPEKKRIHDRIVELGGEI